MLRHIPGELANWDLPKFAAARASFDQVHNTIAQAVLNELQKHVPDYQWTYLRGNSRGQPQGPLPPGAYTCMIHPNKYVEEWHQDMRGPESDAAKTSFLKNQLEKFVLRMTVALPLGETPTTWVKPIRGIHQDKPVHVAPHLGIAFIMDFISHTTPQFEGDFRYLYVLDFEANRKH